MLIDWFTVGAQALNFLILVWLMKRFLYRPVLDALAARERLVAAELADAAAQKAAAQKERAELQQKNEELDRRRAGLLSTATDEAQAERRRLLGAARQAADALSARRQEALLKDAASLHLALGRRTQEEVFAIARQALTDLATTSLEERLAEVFSRRLRQLDGQAQADLAEALQAATGPVLVRSAFELPAAQRAAIQNVLDETFAAKIDLRFAAAPDLISGIELDAGGQKVAWSIADYLASLEKSVAGLLEEKRQEKSPAPPAPLDTAPRPPERAAAAGGG